MKGKDQLQQMQLYICKTSTHKPNLAEKRKNKKKNERKKKSLS